MTVNQADLKQWGQYFYIAMIVGSGSYVIDDAGDYGPGNHLDAGWKVADIRWMERHDSPESNGDYLYAPASHSPNVVVLNGNVIARKAQEYLTSQYFKVDTNQSGRYKGFWRLTAEGQAKIMKYGGLPSL